MDLEGIGWNWDVLDEDGNWIGSSGETDDSENDLTDDTVDNDGEVEGDGNDPSDSNDSTSDSDSSGDSSAGE